MAPRHALPIGPLAVFLTVAAATSGAASTLHVDDDAPGDPGPGDPDVSDPAEDGTAAHPFDRIQEAIDAAADGDVVAVAPGTFAERIDFLGKAITVWSTHGPDVTTIDGGGGGPVVTCATDEGPATVLSGFTVTGGFGDNGGGMFNYITSPTVVDCCFRDNEAAGRGGGMYNWYGQPTVVGCRFVANRAPWSGAGIQNEQSASVVLDCEFDSNVTDGTGAGMETFGSLANGALVEGCAFVSNVAGSGGGGMNVLYAYVSILDCVFEGNVAGSGGAVYSVECGTIDECVFEGNSAGIRGGAVFLLGIVDDWTVVDCLFAGNDAGQSGGAIHKEGGRLLVDRCRILANTASFIGGGIYDDIDETTVINSEILDNTAMIGGGVYVAGTASMTLVSSTVAGNSAPLLGSALAAVSAPTVTNCVLWGNPGDQIDGAPVVSFSCIEGGFAGAGNIAANPLFVDAAGGDYRLAPGSPCIDAGDTGAVPPESLLDLARQPRLVDDPDVEDTGLGDPPVDMGAYEHQAGACAGDVDGDGDVGFSDLLAVLSSWGPCAGCPEDVDGSGSVDFSDALVVLSHWGPCPL